MQFDCRHFSSLANARPNSSARRTRCERSGERPLRSPAGLLFGAQICVWRAKTRSSCQRAAPMKYEAAINLDRGQSSASLVALGARRAGLALVASTPRSAICRAQSRPEPINTTAFERDNAARLKPTPIKSFA